MLPGGVTESALAVLTIAQKNTINTTQLMSRFSGCQTIFFNHTRYSI
jgi:hypothetical protein